MRHRTLAATLSALTLSATLPLVLSLTLTAAEDPFAKSGNIKPKIVTLTPEEEAAILSDVTVPPEFEVSLFAPSATANYPVYVAAAPNGDLYVSSDGNGSLGRDPGRGRVLRLRDEDGDGRADQVTEFIPDIDSPRGLIWDHDRLYLLHPPHISVHFDRDGNGIAEESKLLIRNIAFGFKDRPADHTTNGLELGIDGWIYIAGGDFGFMDAVGTDGRHLQHRGGGVIRFRPDGTGLELFATGTRNILGTPTSPLLDIFARDNTNDGGGWDVRFHHFTGLEDHGYPRLYMNFAPEHIHPLADYGGGSGCGSVYIHEPGFPTAWADAPFTCDWGRAALFRHSVRREGSTFVETATPQPFIKMTRPTDADVDGLSRVYQASWKGPATFRWNGPDTGYIVRVQPKGFRPKPLPNFLTLSDAKLVETLESESHIRTLNAQRALLRRADSYETQKRLIALAGDSNKPLRARVAALYTLTQRATPQRESARILRLLEPIKEDASLQPFLLRALGDFGLDRKGASSRGPAPAEWLAKGLQNSDPRTQVEAMVAATRQMATEQAETIATALGNTDPILAHTAFQSLAKLGASDACFQILDQSGSSESQRQGAAHALMRMHRADVVDNLIGRLQQADRSTTLRPILATLCRLYHREAPWTGDSWGTRPDTRGPYYQLETWAQSDKILAALKQTLENAAPADAAALVVEMNRNRIQTNEALNRILELASQDAAHLPTALSQLAAVETLPDNAISLVFQAAESIKEPPTVVAQTVVCLSKVDRPHAIELALAPLTHLDSAAGADRARRLARQAFLNSPTLANHIDALAQMARSDSESGPARWTHAGLLQVAAKKNASPEARAQASQAIDEAWQSPERRILLMRVASELRNHTLDARIRAALSDFDPDVAKAAKDAARRLRIPEPGADTTPKLATLTPADAIAQVLEHKGDPAIGEAVFLKAACVTCHTVRQDQPQRGPYLGNIANTYRRRELAESILLPNKTIAQGFATNVITLKDETEHTGFVTNEAGIQVTLRDVAGQEHVIPKDTIQQRTTSPNSIMPPGLMGAFSTHEFASLLDYLEQLAEAK